MRKSDKRGATILSIGLLLLGSAVSAEPPQPTFSADLDTKEGHYSMWRAEGLEGSIGCRFEAEMVTAYEDKRWRPIVTFAVRGNLEEARISLQFLRATKKGALKARLVLGDKNGSKTKELDKVAQVGQPLPMSLRWPGRTMEFLIGEQVVVSVERSFTVTALELSVSTAELKIRNLSFQQVN